VDTNGDGSITACSHYELSHFLHSVCSRRSRGQRREHGKDCLALHGLEATDGTLRAH